MSKSVDTGLYCGLLLVCSCLAMSAALADSFVDPTRPPMLENDPGTPAGSPVLQSVLIAPGRSEAIISGRTVRVGENFGDAQVVRIAETEVTLRNGKDIQTLKLFPNIEKRLTYNRVSSGVSGSPEKREIEK